MIALPLDTYPTHSFKFLTYTIFSFVFTTANDDQIPLPMAMAAFGTTQHVRRLMRLTISLSPLID